MSVDYCIINLAVRVREPEQAVGEQQELAFLGCGARDLEKRRTSDERPSWCDELEREVGGAALDREQRQGLRMRM